MKLFHFQLSRVSVHACRSLQAKSLITSVKFSGIFASAYAACIHCQKFIMYVFHHPHLHFISFTQAANVVSNESLIFINSCVFCVFVQIKLIRSKEKRSQHLEICHWCVHINCVALNSVTGACKRNWRNLYMTQRYEKQW